MSSRLLLRKLARGVRGRRRRHGPTVRCAHIAAAGLTATLP